MPEEFVPRDWQKRFVRTYQTNRKKNFLLEACISAGKTAGSLYAFVSMRSTRELSFLVVVVPAEHLMRQYGQDAFKLFGLNLHCSGTDKRMGRVPTPSELLNSGYHGLVISYQWLTKSDNAEFLAKAIEKDVPGKVFVILDEVHHASEKLAFGQACETAFPDRIIPHRLILSVMARKRLFFYMEQRKPPAVRTPRSAYDVQIVTHSFHVVASSYGTLPAVREWASERLQVVESYMVIYRTLQKSSTYLAIGSVKNLGVFDGQEVILIIRKMLNEEGKPQNQSS